MEKVSGIYRIDNLVTGKFYIGSSRDIFDRWYHHKNLLNRNSHANVYLQRAWNKYGESYFTLTVLEKVSDVDFLESREQHYLDTYKSYDNRIGYNIKPVAGNGNLAESTRRKISETMKERGISRGNRNPSTRKEVAAKISSSLKGREFGNEWKKRISNSHSGRKLSKFHRKQISEGLKGHLVSERTKEKISSANKGKTRTIEQRAVLSSICSDGRRKGSKNSCATINESIAKNIKEDIAQEGILLKDIAIKYEVSFAVVSNIKRGLTWKHV